MVKQRSVALCIIFGILTLGIYWLYLMAAVTNETNNRDNSGWRPSGGLCVLFGILTFGIYSVYWMVRMAIRAKNIHNDDSPLIFIIVFGVIFGIGLFFIVHYNNKIATSNKIN